MRDGEIVFDGPPAALTDDIVREIYNGSGEDTDDVAGERGFVCRPFAPEAAMNA
jgi:ABC-type phosphate/phosphonate transport system ATPase subunit